MSVQLSDSEPAVDERRDRFVAQLYKFMDDRGTPINRAPTFAGSDLDLFHLFRLVASMGGYNRVSFIKITVTCYVHLLPCCYLLGGSVAEWLACWTQAQKGPGSDRSRDAVW